MNDDHDQGFAHDLAVLDAMADRRRVLRWLAVSSLLPVLGCSSTTDSNSGTAGSSGAGTGGAGAGGATGASGSPGAAGSAGSDTTTSCSKIPEETAGPYPGDNTNGQNALGLSGIVRSDITTSFGGVMGTAAGVPLTVKLKIVDSGSCANLAGYAVYIWHCDRDGLYSMYTIAAQNYLRGVQVTDSSGTVTFASIFPACYPGRWPHIHFEVYKDLATAVAAGGKVATSQLALPEAQCKEVFATTGYSQSASNLTQISIASDMVFADGATTQVPAISGNVTDGYVVSLTVGVST